MPTPKRSVSSGDAGVARPRGQRTLFRQSAVSTVGAGAAIASGLLLDAAIALRLGAGPVSDSFFVAARLPVGLAVVLMSVATQTLVPSFARRRVEAGDDGLRRLASVALFWAAAAGVLVAIVGIVGAGPLMRLTAPGLEARQLDVAASVARTMFLIVPLVALAEVLRALLNAMHTFALPAAMNVAMNGTAAAFILAHHQRDVYVIGRAYLIGAVAQLLVMAVLAVVRGCRFSAPSLRGGDGPALGRLAARPLAGAALNPLARVGEQLLVSFLPSGSITILSYGNRLISAIGGGVFFRPVIVALMPRLAEARARRDARAVERDLQEGFQLMLAISLPLAAVVAVLARPMVSVVFHRGNFSNADAALLGVVLAVYAASVPGSGVQRVLLVPFYAGLDTRTPWRNTVYGVVANLALAGPLVLLFGTGNRYAVVGVAAAYALAQYVNVAHAWARLTAMGTRPRASRPFLTRLVAATGAASVAMIAVALALGLYHQTDKREVVLRTAVTALVGAVAFAPAGYVLFSDRRSVSTRPAG
jgi:putative peptidoglycan lipid II flippase